MHRNVVKWAAAALGMASLLGGCASGPSSPTENAVTLMAEENGFDYQDEMRRIVAFCVEEPFDAGAIGRQLVAAGYEARGQRGRHYRKDWSNDRGLLSSTGQIDVWLNPRTNECSTDISPGSVARKIARVGFLELQSRGFENIEVPKTWDFGSESRYLRRNQRLEVTATRPVGAGVAEFDIRHLNGASDPTCRREDLPAALRIGCAPVLP